MITNQTGTSLFFHNVHLFFFLKFEIFNYFLYVNIGFSRSEHKAILGKANLTAAMCRTNTF
jgi:hypothetical protein